MKKNPGSDTPVILNEAIPMKTEEEYIRLVQEAQRKQKEGIFPEVEVDIIVKSFLMAIFKIIHSKIRKKENIKDINEMIMACVDEVVKGIFKFKPVFTDKSGLEKKGLSFIRWTAMRIRMSIYNTLDKWNVRVGKAQFMGEEYDIQELSFEEISPYEEDDIPFEERVAVQGAVQEYFATSIKFGFVENILSSKSPFTESERRLFRMKLLEEMTYQEIAEQVYGSLEQRYKVKREWEELTKKIREYIESHRRTK